METFNVNLNIWQNLPDTVWDKIPLICARMDGWNGKESKAAYYWYDEDMSKKHISASAEPSGLHFFAHMEQEEWERWLADFKSIATEILGFKVGEIENGEVDYDVEWSE